MQRIAAALLLLGLLSLTGCPPENNQDMTPLPDPLANSGQRPGPVYVQPTPQAPSGRNIGGVDVRALVPRGGIQRGHWQVIVVHHSANAKDTPQGMDAWHRQRGWDGLGYDFVIGNGVNYPDGQVFVGHRWAQQLVGAHTKAGAGLYFGVPRPPNFFNERGIGICLIGNFEEQNPTPRQMQTLQLLIQWLSSQTGIHTAYVYGHGEVTHKTQCPGRYLKPQLAAIRRNGLRVAGLEPLEAQQLAGRMDLADFRTQVSGDDLLQMAQVARANAGLEGYSTPDGGFDRSVPGTNSAPASLNWLAVQSNLLERD